MPKIDDDDNDDDDDDDEDNDEYNVFSSFQWISNTIDTRWSGGDTVKEQAVITSYIFYQ